MTSPPTQQDAWASYRRAVAWGLVIGWLITPPENYGEKITTANIQRLVSAVLGLETFEVLYYNPDFAIRATAPRNSSRR